MEIKEIEQLIGHSLQEGDYIEVTTDLLILISFMKAYNLNWTDVYKQSLMDVGK